MYWQYPASSSPQWAYSSAPTVPSCKAAFPSAPMMSVPVANGKYGVMGNDYYHDLFEDDSQVKRPMNSFLLWAKIMRKQFAKDYPNLHNAEISKLLGKVWNGMTTSEKRPFVEKAEKLRVLHMRDHPNYRYAPKKKKEKRAAQRMIPPEVAAAFHNAIFDLKGTKNGNTESFLNLMQEELGDDRQEKFPTMSNDVNRITPQLDLYKQNFDKLRGYTTLSSNFNSSFDDILNVRHSCGSSSKQSISPKLTFSHNNNPSTRVQYNGPYLLNSRPNGKSCRFEEREGNEMRSTKLIQSENQFQDNLDQVTPSSPQDHCESLSYNFHNDENFYPPVDSNRKQAYTNRLNPYDFDSCNTSDGDSTIPSSPENCYEDEVPPFLRVLLEKPIHLEQPKCQPSIDKDDEIIFHDLGEIIGKELGIERKACLYS